MGEDLAKPYVREVFDEIIKSLEYRQISVLTGLRRVDKSTLMFQTINHLLESGADPRNIVYLSFDEKISDLLELLNTYSRITGVNWKRERVYVFFDEIQKPGD